MLQGKCWPTANPGKLLSGKPNSTQETMPVKVQMWRLSTTASWGVIHASPEDPISSVWSYHSKAFISNNLFAKDQKMFFVAGSPRNTRTSHFSERGGEGGLSLAHAYTHTHAGMHLCMSPITFHPFCLKSEQPTKLAFKDHLEFRVAGIESPSGSSNLQGNLLLKVEGSTVGIFLQASLMFSSLKEDNA